MNIQEKIKLAREAQAKWKETDFKERSRLLEKAAELTEQYKNDIANTISREMKKTKEEALLDCDFAKDALSFFAKKAPEYLTPESLESDSKVSLYFEPVGVVGAIKPWNFPFDLPIWSCIAPAIMAGNSVILKPSSITPESGRWIEKIFDEAGLVRGGLQVIEGGDEVGRELVQSEVNMISFTGSVEAGREIAIECTKRGRKYVLEMGGKDTAIVMPDCNMKKTAEGIALHGFMNNGQVCTGIERVLIHKDIYEEFQSVLVKEVEKIKPISFASKSQFEIVRNQLKEAIDGECRSILGGKILDEEKWVLEPTIIECENDNLKIWKDETFGPVLAIRSFNSKEEAIQITNNSRYGLGASVWTENRNDFVEIAKKLEAGMVWQNDANLPVFGGVWTGWKDSGFGYSLGKYGTRSYTKIKQISNN